MQALANGYVLLFTANHTCGIPATKLEGPGLHGDSMHAGIPTIDLFAGAGGLSLGALNAGGDVRVHVDNDLPSCETLRANPQHADSKVLDVDVRRITGDELRGAAGLHPKDPLIVVGGAPCQPFSKAAYWLDPGDEARFRRARARGQKVDRPKAPLTARADERRTLIEEWWRLVVESRADGFVFENVPSILHPRNRDVFEGLCRAAERGGYCTTLVKANAAEYGVAQKRQRVFLLGMQGGTPKPPRPTHSLSNRREHGLQPVVRTGEVLAPYSDLSWAEPEEVVVGRWADLLREIPPGMNYKFHTAWAGHPHPAFEAEARFWNFLLKLDPHRPSWTIPANPGPWVGPFHWDSRRLRTAELGTLQGFPHGYVFAGNRRERVRQIGNAIPPPLGRAVVAAVLDALRAR